MELWYPNGQLFVLLLLQQIQIDYQKKLQQMHQHAFLKRYKVSILLFQTNLLKQLQLCNSRLVNLMQYVLSNIYVRNYQQKDIFFLLTSDYPIYHRLLKILKECMRLSYIKIKLSVSKYPYLSIYTKNIVSLQKLLLSEKLQKSILMYYIPLLFLKHQNMLSNMFLKQLRGCNH